ncbi:MAG: glutamate racemase [Candidatus Eremiobacteraeota bacterium]|nr:glutamate racemase [Candidatus Eremiobacteraeota bacterium]
MIGLFDSGLGGLTVVRQVRRRLPRHDLVFFADQAHVPYGERTTEDLHRLLEHNIELLDARGVDTIVAACNTSCAIAQRYGWPQSRALVLDLIESAAIAVERAGYRRVGVVATSATARSGAYAHAIRARVSGAEVYEVAAPSLVPLVEAGKLAGDEPARAVAEVIAELPRSLDAVILACTHYPLLDLHFANVLGSNVARLDPAEVQAERAAMVVTERMVPANGGAMPFITNSDATTFAARISEVMGIAMPSVERLEPLAL